MCSSLEYEASTPTSPAHLSSLTENGRVALGKQIICKLVEAMLKAQWNKNKSSKSEEAGKGS